MAAAGARTFPRLLSLLYFLLVILIHHGSAHPSVANASQSPPSYVELSTSLVVNQLAILQMMQDISNASCAAADAWREREVRLDDEARMEETGLEEALRVHLEQVVAEVKAGQQNSTQVLETISSKINSVTQDALTRVTELRDEMRQEMDRFLEEINKQQEEPATAPPPDRRAAVSPHFATQVHNDTLPSVCNGDKSLLGSIGTLEVIKEGTYSSNTRCSWNITLPVMAPLSLKWDYIDTEPHKNCAYDWVEVLDVTQGSTSVYGSKLCGSISSSTRVMLDVVLPPVQNIFVSFRSDGSNEKRGFRLHYHVDLGGK